MIFDEFEFTGLSNFDFFTSNYPDYNGFWGALNEERVMREEFVSYFLKALHDTKAHEILTTYRDKNFSARRNVRAHDLEFDIVVQKGGKAIAFEIATAPHSPRESDRIRRLSGIARSLGYDFRVVTIVTPRRSTIEIDWLEEGLIRHLRSERRDMIRSLAPDANYEEMGEFLIRSVRITDSEATVEVSGDVLVSSRDPDIREEMMTYEKIPFGGSLLLNLCENKIKEASVKIDADYWYE